MEALASEVCWLEKENGCRVFFLWLSEQDDNTYMRLAQIVFLINPILTT